MSKFRKVIALVVLTICARSASAVDTLYVLRVGDGAAALTNASTAGFIDKFDPTAAGSALSTINLPTTDAGANKPLTFSGTATSEGFIALSSNGSYVTLGGYGIAPGTAGIAASTSAVANRVVGRVDVSTGTIDTTTALTDAYSGGNIRSAVSSNGTDFWTTGSNGAVRYATLGATTTTQLNTIPTNTRVANIFAGQLYTSASSGAFQDVSTVGTGLPTTSGQTVAVLPGMPTAAGPSGYDFWFKDATTLYVADDRTIANGGGIQKWSFDGSNWALAYTLATGGTAGARGLDGRVVGADTILYATTSDTLTKLISITDTGAGSTPTLLATAATNTAFRGVAFVPGTGGGGVTGDYNGNGVVDGADYVLWRKDPGSFGGPGGYDVWRSHFGNTSGSGAGLGAAAVPEPASAVLLLFGFAALGLRRRAA